MSKRHQIERVLGQAVDGTAADARKEILDTAEEVAWEMRGGQRASWMRRIEYMRRSGDSYKKTKQLFADLNNGRIPGRTLSEVFPYAS